MVFSEQGTTRVHGCERHDGFSGLGQDPFMDRIMYFMLNSMLWRVSDIFCPSLQVVPDLHRAPSIYHARVRSSSNYANQEQRTTAIQYSPLVHRRNPVSSNFQIHSSRRSISRRPFLFTLFLQVTDISVAKAYIARFSSKQTTCILASEPGTSDSPASWICRSHSKHPSDYHIPQDFEAKAKDHSMARRID